MVRCAQTHHFFEAVDPVVPGLGGVVVGAAGHQPTHAVAKERQFHVFGQHVDEFLQLSGEGSTILGDVKPGIVPQMDGPISEFLGQQFGVTVAVSRPMMVRRTGAVEQHQDLVGTRAVGLEFTVLEANRPAIPPKLHRDGQRIVGLDQVVTDHAVDRRNDRLACRRGLRLIDPIDERLQAQIHPGADQTGNAADVSVYEPRDAPHPLVLRPTQKPSERGGRVVDRLDQVRHLDDGVDRQFGGSMQLRLILYRFGQHPTPFQ